MNIKWEAAVPAIFFKCSYGVFPAGGESSLCYTTSSERAEWIAQQLSAIQDMALALSDARDALKESNIDKYASLIKQIDNLLHAYNEKTTK